MSTAARIPTSVVRQHFSDALERAQTNEVHIVRGSAEKGKPVAVLLSQERFAALTRRADAGEAALQALDVEATAQLQTGSSDPSLAALQSKIRSALANLRPSPRYTLKELLAKVPPEGLPIDHEFDMALRVGKEAL